MVSTAAASPPGTGVSSAHRPSNSVENPESGPEYSVPAIGCPGTNRTLGGRSGPTSRITDILVLPTSVTIAPAANTGAIAAAIPANAPTGAASITQSAPRAASAASGSTRSAIPNARARSNTAGLRSVTTNSRHSSPRAIATRATELPINPSPTIQSRSKSGSGLRSGSDSGLRSESDSGMYGVDQHILDQPALLIGADRDPDALPQPIAAHRAAR